MEYCCHIWFGTVQYLLSSIDIVQSAFDALYPTKYFSPLQPFSYRVNMATLSSVDISAVKISDESHFTIAPVQTIYS